MRSSFIPVCAAALLTLAGCGGKVTLKAADSRNAAPEFELKDSTGKSVKLSDYKGKVVILNFWATWCAPCKIEIPWFVEFEQKHKDQGFAVLGVSLDDEGWDVVRGYMQKAKINYRVLMGTDEVARLYGGVDALPTTFVLDRQGKIAATHVGLVSKSQYQNDIEQLLNADRAAADAVTGTGAHVLVAGAN
jgi:peroxiredoxin